MVAPTVLIPVEFPDPDPLPSTFIDGLTACKVVLLGAYELSPDVDPDDRQRKEVVSDDPSFEIGQAMRDYDLLVMGETQESPLERVFGRTYESTAEQTHRPIIVVQE
ncbi:universal stress protein [Halomicrococcus gelatinilyticus]|uniref:universal stress protein n=1 Tax=Halomicrococcus gelatinilyticus TaxID=1702103 RepID=UPI002E10ACC6